MIERDATQRLLEQARKFPVISIAGPRQSGKTTLARRTFPNHEYLSFENPDTREAFQDDPRGFLSRHDGPAVFDEAQRVPELFSYLQGVVDSSGETGRFIITGSQNFLLSKAVGQSLAGRVALFTLLPLSCHELESAGIAVPSPAEWVVCGGYPRIFDVGLEPRDFYPGYIETYLQRDVRDELGVRALSSFKRFLQICALSTGTMLNVASLASDCGVDAKTARGWLSVLEASGIVYLLTPFFSNTKKRLMKRPKLYFLDTGLACSLIGVEAAEELQDDKLRGQLFESAVVAEFLKTLYASGSSSRLSYWRDSNGDEIDLILERGVKPVLAVEVKSSTTYRSRYFDELAKLAPSELGLCSNACAVVYGGEDAVDTKRGCAVPFRRVASLLA